MTRKRTAKEIRADIFKINLESKTLKQQMKIIAKQYTKLGRKIPKKVREGRANKRDIIGYMKTLIKLLDNIIEKRELSNNKEFINALNELNNIQRLRHKTISAELQGYDKQFVREFLSGKVAILGRDSTTSVVNTNLYDIDRVIKLAERNKVSEIVYLKQEIEASKKALKDFENDNPRQYIVKQIQDILLSQGYELTSKNLKDINNRIKTVDWLGGVRIIKSMERRIETKAYESYKGDWDNYGNRKLMEIILEDIKRASHNNMVQHVRLID